MRGSRHLASGPRHEFTLASASGSTLRAFSPSRRQQLMVAATMLPRQHPPVRGVAESVDEST